MPRDLHYGVSVGIDYYPGLTDLHQARQDAQAFADWLTSVGVKDGRLETVIFPDPAGPRERRGAQPRVDQIWEAVRDKIAKAREAVKNDPARWVDTRLYFFFSGHGIAPTARDAAGLAADCSADDYGNSASIRLLVDHLLESGDFAEVVAVADCCRLAPTMSSAFPGRPPWTPRSASRPADVRAAELYATRYRTAALEPGKKRDFDSERGYFTRAILEGLSGDPGAVVNGSVTTVSLMNFVRQRVIDLTGGRQTPPRDVGADLLLATGLGAVAAAGRRQRRVRLVFPTGFSDQVSLLDGALNERATHQSDGTDWVVDLEPGLYIVESSGHDFDGRGNLKVMDMEGELVVNL